MCRAHKTTHPALLTQQHNPPPTTHHRRRAQKSNSKYGNEHEAIAVYHMLRGVEKFCPIYTLCIGNAFGEAALLLSAGTKGKRAALRSSTIMIRQPLQRLAGMQASDIDIYRRVTREKTATMVRACGEGGRVVCVWGGWGRRCVPQLWFLTTPKWH